MEIALFYVPCGSVESARQIVQTLLEEKMIACGNITSSHSIYIWQESLQKDDEWIVIIKTLPNLIDAVERKIKSIHTYTVPAIIHWTARCDEAYYMWIRQNVKQP